MRLRVAVRLIYILAIVLIVVATADSFRMGHRGRLVPEGNMITVFAGLWFSSAVFAYLAVKVVRGIDRGWTWFRKLGHAKRVARVQRGSHVAPAPTAAVEMVPDPSRRYFFRTATALAGAAPFLSAVYGFASERLLLVVNAGRTVAALDNRVKRPAPHEKSTL